MSNEPQLTIIGNLTADPELRYTPSGAAVANVTVASTPRTFDRNRNEWVDGETLFLRGSIWREAAENVAETLTKGTRVIVTGKLVSRTFETKQGEKRTVPELEIDEIGPSLRYATARVERNQRNAGQGQQARQGQWQGQQGNQNAWSQQGQNQGYGGPAQGQQGNYTQQPQQGPQNGAQQPDPWQRPMMNQNNQGQWNNGPDSNPPF